MRKCIEIKEEPPHFAFLTLNQNTNLLGRQPDLGQGLGADG